MYRKITKRYSNVQTNSKKYRALRVSAGWLK